MQPRRSCFKIAPLLPLARNHHLGPELADDVQEHDDADKAEARHQYGGGAHLKAGGVVRVELQDVGAGTGRSATADGHLPRRATSLRALQVLGGGVIARKEERGVSAGV